MLRWLSWSTDSSCLIVAALWIALVVTLAAPVTMKINFTSRKGAWRRKEADGGKLARAKRRACKARARYGVGIRKRNIDETPRLFGDCALLKNYEKSPSCLGLLRLTGTMVKVA